VDRLFDRLSGKLIPSETIGDRRLEANVDAFVMLALLSGTAVFPLPVVVSTVEVAANEPIAALAPPADFSGNWNITKTPPGSAGVMVISQDGTKLEISL